MLAITLSFNYSSKSIHDILPHDITVNHHELIRALKADRKDRSIRIITNGAFRTVDWWEQLAPLLDSPGDCLTFSIDGISDNNPVAYSWSLSGNTLNFSAGADRSMVRSNIIIINDWNIMNYVGNI